MCVGSGVTSPVLSQGSPDQSVTLCPAQYFQNGAYASVFLRCTEHQLAGVALHEQINVPFFAVLNLEALGGGEQGVATGPGIRQAGSCLVPVQMDQADMWVVWPDWLGESRVWLVRVEAVTLTLCRWGPSMLTLPPALSLVLVSADCGISIIESRPPNRTLASLQALRRCQEQGHSLRVSQQCCPLGRG